MIAQGEAGPDSRRFGANWGSGTLGRLAANPESVLIDDTIFARA